MRSRSGASRPKWVAWSGLAVALVAAAALGTTVFVARGALEAASMVVARGEGESLVAALRSELTSPLHELVDARLATSLAKHQAEGLRYVAIVRGGEIHAHAGSSGARSNVDDPDQIQVVGRRVRLAASLGPPRDGARPGPPPRFREHDDDHGGPPPRPDDDDGPPGRPPFDRGDGPPWASPDGPGPGGPPFGRHVAPLLVVEFETPVLERLREQVTRMVVIGAVASIALLAFAAALSRSVLRLAAIEKRAERERRLVALGQMSSVMAHELRNPLASLKGHAQLLCETLEDDPRAKAKAERVVSDAERLERLTSSLLEFAREGPLDRGPVTASELVDRALEHLRDVDVSVDVDGAIPQLSLDVARVARALGNIIQNAGQAGGDAPVELRAWADHGFAVIEVRDHGPGLAEADRDRMFEPFVTTKVRGTGLGLPIARRIVELHGGTLTGETHPGGGALFRLRVPI